MKIMKCQKFSKLWKNVFIFISATPSLFIVWLTGLLMGNLIGFDIWLIIKIGFVILLSLYHVYIGLHLNRFKNNQQERTAKFFRLINEIPFILLLLIVILVVFKPFLLTFRRRALMLANRAYTLNCLQHPPFTPNCYLFLFIQFTVGITRSVLGTGIKWGVYT